MSGQDCIVLGAGIVGVSAALHLQSQGWGITLVDKSEPGRETSFGNAGLIELSTAFPHPCPQDAATLLRYALNRSADVRYDFLAMPAWAGRLFGYWRHSRPDRIAPIGEAFRNLVANSLREHEAFAAAAGVEHLFRRGGWLELLTSKRELERASARIAAAGELGIAAEAMDGRQLAAAEPALQRPFAGALHWKDPVGVTEPGGYVDALAALFRRRGGSVLKAQAKRLRAAPSGWIVETNTDSLRAGSIVVALGPWSAQFLAPLGYRFPMMPKRGYHMHYALPDGVALNRPVHIPGSGYLLSPMRRGLRLTTGIELANRDAPVNTLQLDAAEARARQLLLLGDRLDDNPWLGARPCMPDMLPVIGRSPRHRGLWFAFGHGHHGFTLGPVTGRLLGDMMTGQPPAVDTSPYAPERFR